MNTFDETSDENICDMFKVNNNEDGEIFDVSCDTSDIITDDERKEEQIPLMRVPERKANWENSKIFL